MKKEKYNVDLDGMEPLKSIFKNENDFLIHFFSNVKFFRLEEIEKQKMKIQEKINKKEPLPVRFSFKSKEHFYYKNQDTSSGNSTKTFKNKSDAQNFSEGLIHRHTHLNVCIDKDGNYYVRKQIFDSINYKVSQGAISDIKNYMICHVWGETANPLFFTSLWNVVLIPQYLSFLTDKPDENSSLVKNIKNILKAICVELYNPVNIIKTLHAEYDLSNISAFPEIQNGADREYMNEIYSTAKKYIKEGVVKFIDKKPTSQDIQQVLISPTPINSDDDNKSTESLANKNFIMKQLDLLKVYEDESLIEILTNPKECNNKFEMAFPILREYLTNDKSIFEDNTGRQRYYKKDFFFEANNKKYIICNHWYPRQRELFELWVYDNININ